MDRRPAASLPAPSGHTGIVCTACARFATSADAFSRVDASLNGWWTAPARAVPMLPQHAAVLGSSAKEGRQLSETAGAAVEAADYDDLRLTGGQFDIKRIVAVRDPLDRTATSISSVRRAISTDDSRGCSPPGRPARRAVPGRRRGRARARCGRGPAVLGADGPRLLRRLRDPDRAPPLGSSAATPRSAPTADA